MKKFLLAALLVISTLVAAQISTVTNGFSTNLTKSDLNFSGDRKLHAIGLNDRNTENYVVVSKNAKGAADDHLWIEKFTKSGNGFTRTFSKEFTHPNNLSLSFVNNRMTYSDVDKDGNAEFLYVVEANENGIESPLETIWGVCVYNNKAYLLTAKQSDSFQNTEVDPGFKTLPANIQEYFLNFWTGMKKK